MQFSSEALWLHFFLIVKNVVGGNALAAPRTLFGRSPVPSAIISPSHSSAPTNSPVDVNSQYLSTCGHAFPGEIPCLLDGGTVDIYFWPEPDADRACLSIVGNNANSPFPGATTTTDMLQIPWRYWGCTAQHPISGSMIITTATEMITGTITLKQPVVNPWLPQACIEKAAFFPNSSSQFVDTLVTSSSLNLRDHSLVFPPNITQNEGLPVTTVVVENFTFTSPSVYANFNGMVARGACGISTVPQAMLSFTPGELSTYAGPPTLGAENNDAARPFNPADLPCPPKSVMEENWYMPQPGVPYRPIFAVPQKINDLNPLFKMCQNMFFTALDPPRALSVASNLVPEPTVPQLQASTVKPTSSLTLTPDHEENASTIPKPPAPEPAQTLESSQPQQTANLGSYLKDDDAGSQHDPSSTGYGGDPGKEADLPNQNTSGITDEDARQGVNTKLGSQSYSSGDPDLAAVSNPVYGTDSSQDSGQTAADSSSSKDSDNVSNEAAGSGYSSQGSDTAHGQILAIGLQNPGEATTTNGQVGQELFSKAISTVLTSGASPIIPLNLELSLGQPAFAVPSSPTPIAILSDSIQISDQVMSLDGAPALTVSGVPMLLDANAQDIRIDLTPPLTELPEKMILTAGGQMFRAAPAGFSIAGTSLVPSQALTIAGTIISLDASSNLYIGSLTIRVGENTALSFPEVFTVALGQVVTADPSAVSVGSGVGLVLGGDGIATVSATSVLSDSAGELVAGSKTTSNSLDQPITGGGADSPTILSGANSTNSVGGEVQAFQGGAKALQVPLSLTFMMLLVSTALILTRLSGN